MRSSRVRRPGLALLALVAGACAAPSGELLIVGGGLQPDNEAVLGAFTHGAGARLVVLPTASGVPLESGPGTAADLARHADPGQQVAVVELLSDTPERAADPAWVAPLERADGVWFTGGVQSRVVAVFRPDGVDSPAYAAVAGVLARGGRVGGTSAGAAMMCDPMIAGGSSRAALLEGPRAGGFELEQGMGFFPYGLVDQHFLRRGRIGRLVVALELCERAFGFGVAEDCALHVDLGRDTGRPIGERAVLMLDARGAERVGRSRRGLRASLLSDGDVVELATGDVRLADDKRDVAAGDDGDGGAPEALDPFGPGAVTALLERLAAAPGRPQRAEAGGIALVVRADARTRCVARGPALAGLSVRDALLDLEIAEDAALDARR